MMSREKQQSAKTGSFGSNLEGLARGSKSGFTRSKSAILHHSSAKLFLDSANTLGAVIPVHSSSAAQPISSVIGGDRKALSFVLERARPARDGALCSWRLGTQGSRRDRDLKWRTANE